MAIFIKYEKLIPQSLFCNLVFIFIRENDSSTEAAPTEIKSLFKLGHTAVVWSWYSSVKKVLVCV